MDFKTKLEQAVKKNNSLLCVGLDPDPTKTKGSLFAFNKKIIDATAPFACCFKPQIAFYSAKGPEGLLDLKKTITYIQKTYLLPVLLDAKRADIGNTNEMYAKEAFDYFGADALTVNPYLGIGSLQPFLERKNKNIFVLVRTSNPESSEFQALKVGKTPLFIKVVEQIRKWGTKYKNISIVVGVTWPDELKAIRKILPASTILVPGIGAQDGDLEKTLKYGLRKDKMGLIISSSRSIIYADNPHKAAQTLRDEINNHR